MPPRLLQHPWRWTGGAVVVLLILLAPLLFDTVIIPPAEPPDPVTVFLLDHGATPTLVVPRSDGRLVRYAYGDWQYYALANNHALRGIAALVWPTQGTLGRQALDGPGGARNVRRQVPSAIETLHEIRVSREAADRLVTRLDALYEQYRRTEVENAPYGMHFVHHPRRYTYFKNSNHAVAGWLEELGCVTRGPAFYSRWRVERWRVEGE
jgi:hypothetical protein